VEHVFYSVAQLVNVVHNMDSKSFLNMFFFSELFSADSVVVQHLNIVKESQDKVIVKREVVPMDYAVQNSDIVEVHQNIVITHQ
jgi:hypothetical protein